VQLLPDAIVRLRHACWRVVDVRPYDDCSLVTLRGLSPPYSGVDRRVLLPFDRIEPVARADRPLTVGPRRWRRLCRAVLAADTPPAALRAAAHARIDLHAHQVAPALAVVRGLGCRVLLADGVGLGKTIQAGLIVSELRSRGAAERVLVLTPAGLRDQWQCELRDRFGLTPVIADAPTIRMSAVDLPPAINPWSTLDAAVASIDYVKRPEVLAAVAVRPWDIVIVDEAHGAASDSERREAVRTLCVSATYVLLLTATPHSGDAATFESLCRLGQTDGDHLVVFRRTRHDAGIGVPRRVHTLRVRPTAPERRMHAALRRYGGAVIDERPHAWLALSVLHKRAFSSAAALADSIDRRIAALEGEAPSNAATQLAFLFAESGEETSEDQAPAWAMDLALSDADRERELLVALSTAARAAAERESKVRALARLLRRVRESVLIFTEYRDTLRHLQRALSRPVIALHGGMTRGERRDAVAAFNRTTGAVMLATDAAGEGLNLQASCRLVVNLELPWNPMRLEQRIGRVDRIDQRRTVHAIHLVARGTGELAVLARLRARLAEAQSVMGGADPLRSHDGQAAATQPCMPDLGDAARVEVRRLLDVRRLLAGSPAAHDGPPRPLALRARPKLRRALGGRALEIWRFAADDERGRCVESQIVALVMAREQIQRSRCDVPAALEAASRTWRLAAERAAAAFSSARLERNVAIVAQDASASVERDQLALFASRRRDREQQSTSSERASRRLDLERRLADARAAARLAFRSPELLFVVSQP